MDRSGCVRTKQITSWRKLMIKMSRKNVTSEEKESNFLNSFKSWKYSWFNCSYIRQHSSTLSHLLSLFLIINSCCFNYKKAYVCWKMCVTRSSNKTHRNVSYKTKRLERRVYLTPCWGLVVTRSVRVNHFQVSALSRSLGLFFLPIFFPPKLGVYLKFPVSYDQKICYLRRVYWTFDCLLVTWCTNRFNIQQSYALPTLYLCVLYLSQNKQRLLPRTT